MIDDALDVIEKDNSSPKAMFPTNYSRASRDKLRLGQLIDFVGGVKLGTESANRKRIERWIKLSIMGRSILPQLFEIEAPSRNTFDKQ